MRRLTRIIFLLLICFALCSVSTISLAQPAKDVIVTNPDSLPVPVKGNVGINGTPNVNVTNTVPTMNVENPAHFPFVGEGDATFQIGQFGMTLDMGTVPSGKRLVIEQVGITCFGDADDDFPYAIIKVWRTNTNIYSLFPIPLSRQGVVSNSGPTVWVASQALRLYSEGVGEITEISINHKKTTATASCAASLSGYTVDVP